ncbi:MAG: hypothetical protein QXQ52_01670 [Candidatus Methanomethylicaceae archaeon]
MAKMRNIVISLSILIFIFSIKYKLNILNNSNYLEVLIVYIKLYLG